MTSNQDARPFVDLQKDAEEFREKFDEDIKECIDFLDAKITALICDPDSVSNTPRNIKQNALVEFSRAKYDIFMSIKSLINTKEREWIDYMSEMKKLFIDNVEIFLAGTKLEVKLPSSEFEPSPGPRKSPGNRKSTSMTSSIFPILDNIAKNIPGLGSSLQTKEIPKVGENVQFNRGSRLSTKLDKPPIGGNVQFNRDSRSSTKLDKPPSTIAFFYEKERDSSESSGNEVGTGRNKDESTIKGRLSATSFKLVNSSSGDDLDDVTMDIDKAEYELNTSKSGLRSNRKSEKNAKFNSPDLNTSLSNRSQRSSLKTELNTASSPDVPEEVIPAVQKKYNAVSRSVPSRRAKKSTKLLNETPQQIIEQEDNENTSMPKANQRSKKSSGRQLKPPANASKSSSSSEENDAKMVETIVNLVKGRRGKRGAKVKVVDSSSEKENVEIANDVIEEESSIETFTTRALRGRSAASKNTENSVKEEEVPVRRNVRGRRGVKAVTESHTIVPSCSKSNLTSSDEHIEPEPDVYSSVTRPVKAAGRRKTLLPNLEHVSVSEIIPGNSSRVRSKRKTIGGVAELEAATSSKRLKVSGRKNIASVQEEGDEANDNLLESDDNYSEWMSVKNVDGKIPTTPAIYEVKVWRAKKPAYIGFSESLRQKLSLYKLRQNSGHKHLDKFIDRNYEDIQIRFEVVPSVDFAKQEVKKRVTSFTAQYKTTPAYN